MIPFRHSSKTGFLFLILMVLRVTCSSTTEGNETTHITGFSIISTDERKDTFIDEEHRLNAQEMIKMTIRLYGMFSSQSAISFSPNLDCSSGAPTSKVNILKGSENMVAESFVELPKAAFENQLVYICLNGKLQGKYGTDKGEESVKPWLTIKLFGQGLPLWIKIVIIAVLLFLSALFSGLNLGLLSLDKTDLKVIINTGSQKERSEALSIIPVRNHGNLLLCTLVFSNVLVNTILTLVIDDVLSGNWETIVYTTLSIVVFGEILPQAVCSRYGLLVGAKTIWITKFFMFITFPMSYPTGKLLDIILGEEVGAVYTRDRLKELLKVTRDQHILESEEMGIIAGTLDMKRKTVKDIMVPTDNMFMISYETILTRQVVSKIEDKGYSRIPIFQGERWNVIGLINLRQLAVLDPEKPWTVQQMLDKFKSQTHLFYVFENTRLDYMLKAFKDGSRGHMAFIQRINDDGPGDPKYETLGLVTMEDVLEELLQAEIYDEADVERLQLRPTSKVGRRNKNRQ